MNSGKCSTPLNLTDTAPARTITFCKSLSSEHRFLVSRIGKLQLTKFRLLERLNEKYIHSLICSKFSCLLAMLLDVENPTHAYACWMNELELSGEA